MGVRERQRAVREMRGQMVASQARAEDGGLVEHVRAQLDAAEARCRCVQRRVGASDAGPAHDLLGRHADHNLRNQQVVGEVEVLRQPSAGEPPPTASAEVSRLHAGCAAPPARPRAASAPTLPRGAGGRRRPGSRDRRRL